MHQLLNKIPAPALYFLIGALLGGALLYFAGYLAGIDASRANIAQCEERVRLLNKALEKAVSMQTEAEREAMALRAEVEDLRRMVTEIERVLRGKTVEGGVNSLKLSAEMIHVVPNKDFCVEIHVENTSGLQKIVRLALSGNGLEGAEKAVSIGPNTEMDVPLCGTLRYDVAAVDVLVDGERVLTFYVVLST